MVDDAAKELRDLLQQVGADQTIADEPMAVEIFNRGLKIGDALSGTTLEIAMIVLGIQVAFVCKQLPGQLHKPVLAAHIAHIKEQLSGGSRPAAQRH